MPAATRGEVLAEAGGSKALAWGFRNIGLRLGYFMGLCTPGASPAA
jgi:hypothetical protein